MPLEDLTGPSKFINALNSLNPDGATDRINEGDDHLRGIKNVLINTFPNITAAITDTAAVINTWEARILAREAAVLQPDAQNPVGTVKITTDNTNPGTYIAGTTWIQIGQGRCLIGEGSGAGLTPRVAAAELGSEDQGIIDHDHELTDPGHMHTVVGTASSTGSGGASGAFTGGQGRANTNTTGITVGDIDAGGTASGETILATGQGVDANMQPSLVVYFWERTV